MLLGIINNKTTNEDYYIDLENKNNNNIVTITHVNDKGIQPLPKKDALELLKTLISSKLSYLEDYKGYKVYLDESNNKRYFKNGEEDYKMFFENNGTDALLYIKKIEKTISPLDAKRIIITKGGTFIMITLLLTNISMFIECLQHSNNPLIYSEYVASSYPKLDLEECKKSIYAANNISQEDKDILYNESLLEFVLAYSKNNQRNYELTRKLNNINIVSFAEEDIKNGETIAGYYTSAECNKIHIKNRYMNKDDTYYEILTHEYIHLLQNQSEYTYITEAGAEIFSYEYCDAKPSSYNGGLKRVKVLMEIIGPEAIAQCNFGDVRVFENEIGKYLSNEDKCKLLDLFKQDSDETINKNIDEILARMYYNKTGKDINDDTMIRLTYLDYTKGRIYFNSDLAKYNEDYFLGHERVKSDNLRLEDIVNSDLVEQYSYPINKEKIIGGKTHSSITLKYVKDFNSIKLENQKFINIEFKNGTIGSSIYDEETNTWGPIYLIVKTYEPSIPKKFPSDHAIIISKSKPEIDDMIKPQESSSSETKTL